jgi:hypothetical protein
MRGRRCAGPNTCPRVALSQHDASTAKLHHSTSASYLYPPRVYSSWKDTRRSQHHETRRKKRVYL